MCVFVCVCSPLGEGRGRAWPRPLEPAASAPHEARGALRSVESGPGGGGGLSAALELSQWAGVLPGSWPRPRARGAPFARLVLTARAAAGRSAPGAPGGSLREQTSQEARAKDATLGKVRGKEKPMVRPASGRLEPRAELAVCPGGDRVTAWQRPGWPRRNPEGTAALQGHTAK